MTQDEIIEMAYEAYENCDHIPNLKIPKEFIESFAKLIAEREREACLEIIDNFVDFPYLEPTMKAIRARSKND
jgi:hypothetical protein